MRDLFNTEIVRASISSGYLEKTRRSEQGECSRNELVHESMSLHTLKMSFHGFRSESLEFSPLAALGTREYSLSFVAGRRTQNELVRTSMSPADLEKTR